MSSFIKKRRLTGLIKPAQVAASKRPPRKSVYQIMVERNPSLALLMEQLDLELVSEPQFIEVMPPAPARQEPSVALEVTPVSAQEVNIDKLGDVARRSLLEGDNLTREEVIERIARATNVTQQRAANGFDLMVSYKILLEILGQTYYLADSTPF